MTSLPTSPQGKAPLRVLLLCTSDEGGGAAEAWSPRAAARRGLRRQTAPARKKIAQEIASQAKAVAPVLTGDYRDGIGVNVRGTMVRVVDNDELAIHKEYGTADTPAHATLTGTAMRFGRYRGMRPR